MAGVSVEQVQGSARKPLDSEINLIPMVDLLVCCISFLLITAAWSRMSRLEARAQHGQGPVEPCVGAECPETRVLHVDMRDAEKFRLAWKERGTTLSASEVRRDRPLLAPDPDAPLRYPELAERLAVEWNANGLHRSANDRGTDVAVLHMGNDAPFGEVAAVMDAIRAPRRALARSSEPVPTFQVSLASD
jgi:biopolymer transport protein ExbD